jgi:hypothetical protein
MDLGSLGDGNMDEQHLSSLPDEIRDVGYPGNTFFDGIINVPSDKSNMPYNSGDESSMSDNGSNLKRTTDDSEESDAQLLKDGIKDDSDHLGDITKSAQLLIDLKKSHEVGRKRPGNDDEAIKLRSDFKKYLEDKLAKKLNVATITIPWSKIKEHDIINWPQDVKFRAIDQMKVDELKRLHLLVKEDALDFSSEFLRLRERQSSRSRSVTPEFQEMIWDIETALCNKLTAATHKKFKRVPWTILKKEDIVNWPEGIPFKTLSRQGKKSLRLLHMRREVIFFRKEFLTTISDPSFDTTYIGRQMIQ